MLICSSASRSSTLARAPVRLSSSTASTSVTRYSVPSDVRTFLVVSRSVVTKRSTLGPSASMTVMARISTFSWASAEQIFASLPGLFSRCAVTSLTISIEYSPRRVKAFADHAGSHRTGRAAWIRRQDESSSWFDW